MIIYIVDNEINIIDKQKVYTSKFKSINKGYIISKKDFMEEYVTFLKKEKIKSKLLNNKIEIIFNSFYTESDKFYFENIFLELGYLKVEFKNQLDILEDKYTYIEINNTYMVINLDKGIYFDLEYFKDIPKIIDYFNYDKDIVLFGKNKNIRNIKLKNRNLYYIDKADTFIIDSLLKVNKYGA